jgi:hypothetical protein
MKNIVAFDYNNQCWVEGQAALPLLTSQAYDDLDLANGPEGESYCRLLGVDRAEYIAIVQDRLDGYYQNA